MVSWCGKPQLQDIQPPNLFRVAFRNGPVAVCFDPRRTAVPSRRGSERSGAEGSRADEKTQEGSRRRKAKSFLGLHLVFFALHKAPPRLRNNANLPPFLGHKRCPTPCQPSEWSSRHRIAASGCAAMDASNGAPERAPKSVPSVRSVVFESRFRRSIRLEATRRALQGQWIRRVW